MRTDEIVKQFPIFDRSVHGRSFIYFDSAATAQMPRMVLDAITDYYMQYKANVGRGIYAIAEKATAAYEQARMKVAQFIGASRGEILFTSGATESINAVVYGWAQHHAQAGDEIVLSAVEHHSNFVPWQQLALRQSLVLNIVPVLRDGVVDIEIFKSYLSAKTKLVALVHTSNVTGGTNDVTTLTALAHQVGAHVLIDASQSVAHQKIDVKKINCDFLVFSGHKLFGPTGIGILYAAQRMHAFMKPFNFGGGMVFSVQEKQSIFKDFPHGFEAGTPHIAQAIGLGAALDFMQQTIDFEKLATHETMLAQATIEGLQKIPNIEIMSCAHGKHVHSKHIHMVTFYHKNIHGHDIAAYLDQCGIAVRAGHHCAQLFHEQCGIHASVRVSFSVYNTLQEVEYFLECMKKLTV